ncbi:amino acid adenylation domain-containing protein [Pollutimonas bauzanensis]|uniref:amino acid adenylation domain-containing protein n=1 Tax=Pollutimonas bauzanensis TaxID=658167 RepID=UPI0033408CD2
MSVFSSEPVPTLLADGAPAQLLPLTEAQEGLWYAQRLDTANPIYNTGHCTEIRGPLDVDNFERAVNAALVEADALTLRFIDLPEGPRQYMDPSQQIVLEISDLSQVDGNDNLAHRLMREDLAVAVDPTASPLARHVLFIIGPDHFLWYQRIHHLAADGYGMALIEARVTQLYAAYISGQARQGEPLTSFNSVLTEDAQYRASSKRDTDRAFWLEAANQRQPALSLTDGVPMTSRNFLYAKHSAGSELITDLIAAQTDFGVSWPDILTALCTAYISRHIRQPETTVGVPFMGRLGSVSARAVATVMNVAPLHVAVNEDLAMGDYLKQVQRTLQKTRRHGRYRSEQLRRDLGLLGGNRRLHGPIINVLPFDTPYKLPGLTASQTVLCAGPVEDLTFTFRALPDAQNMRMEIEANPKHYNIQDVQAHLLRLERFISTALGAASLATVPTLTPAEELQWVNAVNDTAHSVPKTHLWSLIETSIRQYPDNSAIHFAGQTLTYAELDTRSRAIAQRLQAGGVQHNDIVALAVPRSIELVLALTAIIRVGAAYLPLDYEQPPERIRHIIASATPRLVLAVDATRDVLPVDCARLLLDEDASGASSDGLQATVGQPDDAAYIIYTSGSTGDPKGVVVSHDAIVNRLLWMQNEYRIGTDERILQKTPATFDVSVWEFFLPLISGATLAVAPPDAHKDPAWLVRVIREQSITTLHFVPSMLAAFLDEPDAGTLNLRRVFCSGEELPAALRNRFHRHINAELHNLYGPTEAAVDVTYWPAGPADTSEPVPIGFPVWNTAMYVLDERLRPLPPGVAGHLYIAGRQLADGYLGRPDLTSERFIADPFQVHGDTMYVTGDIAQWREDGALVFLGRSDHQIKLRGQRIELGEIEAVLAGADGVRHVAVIAREDSPGNLQIVAYLVGTLPGAGIDADVLSHAATRLPDYMLPAALVWLDALPVTVNGKLNRKALPAPRFQSKAGRPPLSDNEIYVAGLFTNILERPALSANDDFFDLGGHSLLAARLALQVRNDRGHDFTLGALFEHPTVARLAAYLDDLDATETIAGPAEGFGPTITLRTGIAAKPALFCIHPAGGLSWCYGALARALKGQRTVYGLQAPALGAQHRTEPADLGVMAAGYVDTILALQPQGPYHLSGWSVGGIIAHAMATELQRRGHQVGVLAMLDAYPSDSWKNQPPPPPDAVYKALLHIAGHDPDTLQDVPMTRAGVIGFLRRSAHPLGELNDGMLEGVFDVVASNNRLVRQHQHDLYRGQVLYFRAALDHKDEDLFPTHWNPYVTSLDVHDIPSLHAHLTGADAITAIAPVLDAHMAAADAGNNNTDQQR